ncbi:MAG: ABC transporter substrate-binding protein [Bifidobacteriaceae bacterium]|jgi:glucose/mannose transport system substrate-binding protein|nr:ABC transporter substrate-binding protein [Bifidobacteriaceae bacterium]
MTIKSKNAAALAIGALLLTGCSEPAPTQTTGTTGAGAATDQLEVFSYWTSGSEEASLNVLFDAYKKLYPNVDIANAAISGGGGANADQVLQSRIAGGNPPDTWQTMPGAVMATFVEQGLAADLTDIFESERIGAVMPQELLDLMSADGKVYTIVAGNHRQNTLWYNKSVLAEAGVTIGDSLSWEQFTDALAKVEASGVTPFCNGDKDIFAAVGVAEVAILAKAGIQNAATLAKGEGWDTQAVREGVADYLTILENTNDDHSALTWDEAVKRMADGGCGFNMMADSAYGELLNYGAVDGDTFGYVDYPGTAGAYVILSDSFVVSATATNAENARNWVKLLGDPAVQTAFSAKKGTIPARTDADTSTLGTYLQWAAAKYKTDTIIPTMCYGMAIGPVAKQGFYDAITQLNQDKNADNFIAAMQVALTS